MSGSRGIIRGLAAPALLLLLSAAPGLEAPQKPEAVTESFIAERKRHGGFPVIAADGTATFVHIGDGSERAVRIRGDFKRRNHFDTAWDEAGEAMVPLAPGSTTYVFRRRFEPDARLDYQFMIDGKAQVDPLNPRQRDGAIYGQVSELVMPRYAEPQLLARLSDPPRGRIVDVTEAWATPRVRVYVPEGYDPRKRTPVIYTADGAAWSDYLRLPQWIDLLAAEGRIRPVIAVMIDAPEDRRRFYYFAPDYLAYLERAVAYVDARYSTVAGAKGRAHVGTSAGARAAMYAAFERPGLFGSVGMLSPAINGSPSYYAPWFSGARRPAPVLKVWISAGSYEGAIFDDARMMEAYFRKAGVSVRTRYTREGHSTATWRNAVPQLLEFLYPASHDGGR